MKSVPKSEKQAVRKKGAEAYVEECLFLGKPAVAKRRLPKNYRITQLDRKLRLSRTIAEAKALVAAKQNGVPCPLVYFVDEEKTEIIMQKLDGELLSRIATGKRARFAGRAGEILGRIHLAGIHHGDYTTTNLMDCSGGLFVIDFGLCERTQKPEDFATDVLLFKKSVGKEEFADFSAGYKKANPAKNALVLTSLADIEARGRYVARGQ